MKQVAENTFTASIENIPQMVAFVAENAAAVGVHPKRVMHLELATEEAVTNICSYAYEVPPGLVSIRISRSDVAVQVDFSDNGVPFDPLAAEAPDIQADLDNREIGGLGIFLIRRLLDEVHYHRRDNRNILTLVIKNAPE
ncbi:ATP-binding protein [Anaeroselena agilis]|uniref:ATP-binding protein n=1 Tax=Anaeroselena agilis TaxID=3063788 RepID=A0ABU3NUM6_9FIRM|nr:ATP-binding protein [Selenomonadales bacterium 4137-cl]